MEKFVWGPTQGSVGAQTGNWLTDIACPQSDSQTRRYVCSWPPVQTESKRSPRYVEPCEIKKIILPAVMKLKLPPALQRGPAFHLSLLKPVSTSALRNCLNVLKITMPLNIRLPHIKNTHLSSAEIFHAASQRCSVVLYLREWKDQDDFLHLNTFLFILPETTHYLNN